MERILSYRRSLTGSEKARFAARVQALTRAQDNASTLKGIRNETILTRLRAFESGLTAREASNLHEHIVRIDESIDKADQDVADAGHQVDKARVNLVERRRDERAVELLRKRRFQTWLRDYHRDEGKTLDDVGMMRHLRQAGENE
jgi:flagellar export protein FliJ